MGVSLLLGPTAPAQEAFNPGSVLGRGQSLRVGGFTGGLEYALTFGVALARAQGAQGNAQAQAVDLGIFGLILSQPGECTGTSALPPEQVPRPLRVSSVEGERSDTNHYADGQFVRGGTEFAAASPQPSARAWSEIAEFELPSLVTMDGLRSTADARIVGSERIRASEATTSVGAIDVAGGMLRLEGVRWSVSRLTGAEENRSERFTVGRIELAGVRLPSETPAQVAEAFAAANDLLAPLGIGLEPPSIRQRPDGTTEITPLLLRVGGNDAANPILGALTAEIQPLRDALYAELRDGGCPVDPTYLNAVLTVFDIAFASLTGSGGLTLELGGARTLHDTTVYESPFRAPLPFTPPAAAVPIAAQTITAPVAGVPPGALTRPATSGRASTRCETTHPSGSPGCSSGSAVLAGGLSLLVAVALLGGDYLRARRSVVSS